MIFCTTNALLESLDKIENNVFFFTLFSKNFFLSLLICFALNSTLVCAIKENDGSFTIELVIVYQSKLK